MRIEDETGVAVLSELKRRVASELTYYRPRADNVINWIRHQLQLPEELFGRAQQHPLGRNVIPFNAGVSDARLGSTRLVVTENGSAANSVDD